MYSKDLRWRAIVLTYLYQISVDDASAVLGPSKATIKRWYNEFNRTGRIQGDMPDRHRRVPEHILNFINEYVKIHPCFYIEELQDTIKAYDPSYRYTSTSTICRILRIDLN